MAVPQLPSGPAQPQRELPDAKYGDNKQFEQAQQVMPAAGGMQRPPTPQPKEIADAGAPTPAGVPGPTLPQGMGAPPPTQEALTGFDAGTTRPNEPVTSGSPLGPGPNKMNYGALNQKAVPLWQSLQKYAATDTTGVINRLVWMFNEQGQ